MFPSSITLYNTVSRFYNDSGSVQRADATNETVGCLNWITEVFVSRSLKFWRWFWRKKSIVESSEPEIMTLSVRRPETQQQRGDQKPFRASEQVLTGPWMSESGPVTVSNWIFMSQWDSDRTHRAQSRKAMMEHRHSVMKLSVRYCSSICQYHTHTPSVSACTVSRSTRVSMVTGGFVFPRISYGGVTQKHTHTHTHTHTHSISFQTLQLKV